MQAYVACMYVFLWNILECILQFLQVFTLFKGKKYFFFQKCPKNSLSTFFKNRGGGGVKPELTNVNFFFLKSSLI